MANKSYLDREAYALARATGDSQAEAARKAGSKASRVDTRARAGMRLEAQEGVRERIEELRIEKAKETRSGWDECLDILIGIARDEDGAEKTADRISAIKEFGKAGGHYAASKIEHSGVQTVAVLDRPGLDELLNNPKTRDAASALLEAHAEMSEDNGG